MGEVLRRYGPALLAWGMLLWLRPSPAPGRRLVRLCVLGIALSQTLLTPAVIHLTHAAGLGGVERLAGHLAMLLACWAGAQVLLHLRGHQAGARANVIWAITAGSVMTLLFALTPDLYPRSPWVMEYCIAYAVALLPQLLIIALLCLRERRAAPDRTLRLGLSLIIAGTLAAACYMAGRTAVAVAARTSLDFSLGQGFALSKALPTAAHLLVLAGVTAPAAATWLRRLRRYRRLRPLWLALYQAEPAIALEPPGLLRAVADLPTRLRLYRRVIEIRDGLLAVRPYRPTTQGPEDGRDHHAREALQIAAALRARAAGERPRSDSFAAPGGHDLSSDTDYLCRLADAYRALTRADRRR
ncbi:MAB_1171c family putative transporter [Streptomyces bauhiniae]